MRTKDHKITIATRFEFQDMMRHTRNLEHRTMHGVFYGNGISLNQRIGRLPAVLLKKEAAMENEQLLTPIADIFNHAFGGCHQRHGPLPAEC